MKLGERFIKKELAHTQQIKKALELQQQTGGRLGDILLAISNIRSIDYYKALAEHYEINFVDLLTNSPDYELLTDNDHDLYLSTLTLPIGKQEKAYTVATANPSPEIFEFIKHHWGQSTEILCTAKFDILATLQERFHDNYLHQSINQLIENNVTLSAKNTFANWQIIFLLGVVSVSICLVLFKPRWFFFGLNIFLTISVSFILLYRIVLSSVALFKRLTITSPDVNTLPTKQLPIYTILIPLYKENETIIKNLFNHIQKIDYPKHLLDIKILIEKDDIETISILKKINFPHNYEFIYIPTGQPRTKAKACNYGLRFARGEYITLYDAEDQPDPYQLKKALHVFLHNKDNNIACVQSKLNFYNTNENWLTKMFTIEYTYWFDLLLPALETLHTPIPLGGTSNHFKTSILKEIDAWDPYNVAEDADIGIRLERLGYISKIIDSTTYEEANCRLINWIKQRSRWIKGYMQTYIVHMRHPYALWRALGARGFIGFQLFVGGTVFSNLSYIVLWIIFSLNFILTREQSAYLFPYGILYLAYFNFFLGLFGIVILNFLGIIHRRLYSLAIMALTSPLYWLLISIASYRALYQLFLNPSYWDKTEHGLSNMLKKEN